MNNLEGLELLGAVQLMPAASGFTMIEFDAAKVPPGTNVYMIALPSNTEGSKMSKYFVDENGVIREVGPDTQSVVAETEPDTVYVMDQDDFIVDEFTLYHSFDEAVAGRDFIKNQTDGHKR